MNFSNLNGISKEILLFRVLFISSFLGLFRNALNLSLIEPSDKVFSGELLS